MGGKEFFVKIVITLSRFENKHKKNRKPSGILSRMAT
jgi:hypothetical protein